MWMTGLSPDQITAIYLYRIDGVDCEWCSMPDQIRVSCVVPRCRTRHVQPHLYVIDVTICILLISGCDCLTKVLIVFLTEYLNFEVNRFETAFCVAFCHNLLMWLEPYSTRKCKIGQYMKNLIFSTPIHQNFRQVRWSLAISFANIRVELLYQILP